MTTAYAMRQHQRLSSAPRSVPSGRVEKHGVVEDASWQRGQHDWSRIWCWASRNAPSLWQPACHDFSTHTHIISRHSVEQIQYFYKIIISQIDVINPSHLFLHQLSLSLSLAFVLVHLMCLCGSNIFFTAGSIFSCCHIRHAQSRILFFIYHDGLPSHHVLSRLRSLGSPPECSQSCNSTYRGWWRRRCQSSLVRYHYW